MNSEDITDKYMATHVRICAAIWNGDEEEVDRLMSLADDLWATGKVQNSIWRDACRHIATCVPHWLNG